MSHVFAQSGYEYSPGVEKIVTRKIEACTRLVADEYYLHLKACGTGLACFTHTDSNRGHQRPYTISIGRTFAYKQVSLHKWIKMWMYTYLLRLLIYCTNHYGIHLLVHFDGIHLHGMRANTSIVGIFRIRECELLYAYGAKQKYKRTEKMHINQWTYSDNMCTIDKVTCIIIRVVCVRIK